MIIIGADESGTGAWAGPFTVCAVAVREEQQARLTELGARDSKKLRDEKRRRIMESLIDEIIVGKCAIGTVESMRRVGKQQTWSTAMFNAIVHVARISGQGKVVIDGLRDHDLARALRTSGIHNVEFLPKADDLVPAVSAASIIAKTLRNDMMIDLHEEYPEYDWKVNMGYPAPKHVAALIKYGKTRHHRPWKNMVEYQDRKDVK